MARWLKKDIDKARINFWAFLYIVWKEVGLPDPTPIQIDIAQTLQNPPGDRFIIQGFRGVAKSFITCAFVVWMLWNNPQLKVMIVSASKDKADANAIFIKKIIQTVPFLKHLLPKKGQRDTQNIFDVAPAEPDISPSVKSVGITGQMTGSRADLLIADDVEVQNNSATQVQRDKLSELIKEFDAILKPGGQIVYLGTPQNEMSIYTTLEKERGYSCRIWPVQYPQDQNEREIYGDRLGESLIKAYEADPKKFAGQPTEPTRFGDEEIAKRKLSYGKAGFALQFMLNTNLSDLERFPLRVQDLIVANLDMEESSLKWAWSTTNKYQELPSVALKGDFFYREFSRSPELAKYTGTVMAIDPSGKGKDETAYAIIKYLNGFLFLMEVGGYQDGYSDATLTGLATKAKAFKVTEIVYESNFGDGMFGSLLTPILKNIYPCSLSEVRNSKQKELRIIDTLEPVMMSHRLIVNASVIEDDYKVYEKAAVKSLIYQMTRISRERGALAHDDRLDAVTMGVNYWVEELAKDADEGLEDEKERMLEEWLEEGLLGRQSNDSWNGDYKGLRFIKV